MGPKNLCHGTIGNSKRCQILFPRIDLSGNRDDSPERFRGRYFFGRFQHNFECSGTVLAAKKNHGTLLAFGDQLQDQSYFIVVVQNRYHLSKRQWHLHLRKSARKSPDSRAQFGSKNGVDKSNRNRCCQWSLSFGWLIEVSFSNHFFFFAFFHLNYLLNNKKSLCGQADRIHWQQSLLLFCSQETWRSQFLYELWPNCQKEQQSHHNLPHRARASWIPSRQNKATRSRCVGWPQFPWLWAWCVVAPNGSAEIEGLVRLGKIEAIKNAQIAIWFWRNWRIYLGRKGGHSWQTRLWYICFLKGLRLFLCLSESWLVWQAWSCDNNNRNCLEKLITSWQLLPKPNWRFPTKSTSKLKTSRNGFNIQLHSCR